MPLTKAGAVAGVGAVAALLRRRRNTDQPADDPVHAPGHRHRKPPKKDRKSVEVDLETKLDQPWIRRSHSDSQKRRFRR